MMKKKKLWMIFFVLLFVPILLLMTGCGKRENKKEKEELQIEEEQPEDLYIVVSHEVVEEQMLVYNCSTQKQHFIKYSATTKFEDKYGNYKSSSEFTKGKVILVGKTDCEGFVTSIKICKEAWEYTDIKRFLIDEKKSIMEIADSRYAISEDVKVFSENELVELADITNTDILTVVGLGREILSIQITTGHGTLSLKNTELFEDSLMQLNRNIFLEISEDLSVELQEGSYTLTVANDGWGGSCQIEILRGKETVVDLETLKGEGKKKGLITFSVEPEEAKVYIDGQLIDHSQAIEITYGTHRLMVKAEGYIGWRKYLTVNSEEATIPILLDLEEQDHKESEESTETEEETETEESTETEEETETEESTEPEETIETEKGTETEEETETEKGTETE